jgi:hypothetical protein
MSKRGRKPLGDEAPIVCWLLVEIERDLKGSVRRRSVREACQRIAERFVLNGASEPNRGGPLAWETIRRQYKSAESLLQSLAGKKEAERAIGELRRRRVRFGWHIEPAALLGIQSADLIELWTGRLAFAPALELAALRSGLRDLEARRVDADAKVQDLTATRDQLRAQLAAIGGKPN